MTREVLNTLYFLSGWLTGMLTIVFLIGLLMEYDKYLKRRR